MANEVDAADKELVEGFRNRAGLLSRGFAPGGGPCPRDPGGGIGGRDGLINLFFISWK